MATEDFSDPLANTFLQDFRAGTLQRCFFILMQSISVCIASAQPTLRGQHVKIPREDFENMLEHLRTAQDFIENYEE